MRIKLNSEEIEIPEGITVKELKELRNIATSGVAVAVNGKIMLSSLHSSSVLREGDDVIVISAAYGG